VSSAPRVTAPTTPQELADAAADADEYERKGYALCQRAEEARRNRDGALAAALDRDGSGLIRLAQQERKTAIQQLRTKLAGLSNDARYWDLVRTYGEYSTEVLRHLRSCAETQAQGANHT
jgi:hypothetical protein